MESSVIMNLVQLRAPKVLVATVLLLRWMDNLAFTDQYVLFDLFSGCGNVHKEWSAAGYSSACFDKLYGPEMDFLSCAGFSLSIYAALNMIPDGVAVIGPDCSSWGIPARGSSGRNFINPNGYTHRAFVNSNNCLVSRMVLLLLVLLSKHCCFIVEQPHQSLLYRSARWEWFCNRVARVFEVGFWMLRHGSPSAKRTKCFSTMATLLQLDHGVLSKAEREQKTTLTTVRKHTNKQGKTTFSGKKAELKQSGT
ncbi:unnamed protein product [Symbiodinium pilosum]|uniref:Uncharacterized protein n=1 Tax=Symbiodinium pilosum TaxID=2952 RepID=A0A812ME41_SYMPI|nr:unnamed protein product [Symbiodinium pilosum]